MLVDSTWGAAVVGGVAGVVTGGLSSILAPWAQWRVERRRLQRAERVAAIRELRELVGDVGAVQAAFQMAPAVDTRVLALRSHMTDEELRSVLVTRDGNIVSIDQVAARVAAIIRVADRLERKWDLR